MRTKNPEPRELEIQWSTQRWVPRILVLPANGGGKRCVSLEVEIEGCGWIGKKPLKRRQTTMLWGGDGSRPTWR